MNINRINISTIQNNNITNRVQNTTTPVKKDTFEKTKVSFKGSSSEDIIDKIAKDFLDFLPAEFLKALTDRMLDDIISGDFSNLPIDVLDEIPDKDFWDILRGLSNTINEYTDYVEYEETEENVQTVLDVFSDKKMREKLKPFRNNKVDQYLTRTLTMFPPEETKYIIALFQSAGIKTVASLETLFFAYSRNPKPFNGQAIEAVEIFGILNNKEDLSKYSELLLYLFNEEYSKDKADYDVLNRTTAFLKQIGLQNFSNFDEKFAHLKSKFNNFEDISDKADAIVYTQKTYEDKTKLLDEILRQNPTLKSQNAEKVYSSINDIIDYFYEANNGNSLNGLSDILEYASLSHKLKPIGLKQISADFNDFKTPEDKVDLYLFLKDCEISISDFNSLVGKSLVSDVETLSFFVNKTELTESISQIKGLKPSESFDFYKKFKDVLNATYDENTESTEEVKLLINIVDRFKLKDSTSFLDFYNKANGIKKQSITTSEIKEFIELFKYIDSPNLLEEARKQNTTAVKLLKQEKERFLSVEKEIQNFIINDEKSYFTGETPLSIYKNYHNALLENPFNIQIVLQNIADFNMANQEDYATKAVQISKFTKFFNDKQSLIKFFAHNNISFNNSDEDNARINNCLAIFNSIYDENEKEKSSERINYFAQSGFISKSETKLNEFLNKMPSIETRKKVLSLIADKKIPSLTQMEKFFKQYQTSKTSGKDLISYLKRTPENIDFAENIRILNLIQSQINQLCIPTQLTGDNIVSMDISKLKGANSIPTTDIVSILDEVYGASEDKNFLSVMSISKDNHVKEVNSFRIAKEIALRVDKSDESYKNITRLLHIDKNSLGLEPNCSNYIYIRAIQDVLPNEFVEFVKSNKWTQYLEKGNKTPALGLHARLRTIDRFALEGASDIKELYTQETEDKLTSLLKTVYTTTPTEIRGSSIDKRIITDFEHNGKQIEVIFTQDGKMITIVPRSKTA